MNWKEKFHNRLLERGYVYYLTGCVQEMSCENDVYRAKVYGMFTYNVEMTIKNDEIISQKCTCFNGKSGYYCEHMAAVLYKINEKEKVLKRISRNAGRFVMPFKKERSDNREKYCFFNMEKMTKNLQFLEEDYIAADKLVKSKKVVLDRVEVSFGHGNAYGRYMDTIYPSPIHINFNSNDIVNARCGVLGCNGSFDSFIHIERGKIVCQHVLALLILLKEYLEKNSNADATDQNFEKMFQQFRNHRLHEVLKQQEQVKDLVFEPVLENIGNELSLSFKTGVKKTYVVKDLKDFIYSYETKSILKMGTKTEIDLAKHRLDDSSEKIYNYVRRLVKAEYERVARMQLPSYVYCKWDDCRNKVDIYGERLDAFFCMLEGKEVAYTEKMDGKIRKSKIKFMIGTPAMKATVKKLVDEDKTFHGVYVTGKLPQLIHGENHLYYFAEDSFCRLDEDMTRKANPVLQLEENGRFSFAVGRNHMSEFYYQVLPMLKQYAEVEEPEAETIQEYIPPQAKFEFYLDAENKNITCNPVVRYGDKKVSLLDHLKKDSVDEPFRNRSQEEDMLNQLYGFFPTVDHEQEELRCEEEKLILRLLEGGVERLKVFGEVYATDRFNNMNIRKRPNIKVGVSIESGIMDLNISSEEIDREDLLQILRSYRTKKKYHRLKDGSFVAFNDEDLEKLGEMLESLRISPKEFVKGHMKIPVYRALYLNKMLEESEDIYLNRDDRFKKLIHEFDSVDDSGFEVPDSLKPVMRNYQVQGFQWMKTLEQYNFGGILADDMGLGKTLQMISVLKSAKENGQLTTALIVSPASLVYNWKEEFGRFAPDLNVALVVGTPQERAKLITNHEDVDVLVTSYDLVKRDILEYEDVEFSHQVLDEAQYVKNHSTAAAKSVKLIKSKHRYALTGTPIENRLSELWSIFDYLMPGYLYGYETFRKEYEAPIVRNQDETASARLKKMVGPFILRRLKGDVLKDLPEKIEEIRYTKMESEQQNLYDAQVVHMQEMLAAQDSDDFQKNKLQVLAELTKLRQICCDPELLFEKYKGSSAKRLACMELIQSAIEGGHKILVFSQFTSMLKLLEDDLRERNIRYYKITGETGKEQRLEMVNAFNKDATPVFLISLKAGGTGLNLVGADVVIHYDPWWNQAAQNQATDRAHRIGQEKVVNVYKVIAKGSIEEKILKMQESKKNLADSILSGDNGSIAQMSKEELLELLAG